MNMHSPHRGSMAPLLKIKKFFKKTNMRSPHNHFFFPGHGAAAPQCPSPSRGSAYIRTYAKPAPKEAVDGVTRVLAAVVGLSSA